MSEPTIEEMRAAWELQQKQREYQHEYQREYRQRPEVKAKRREYRQRPEVKAKRREYMREYKREQTRLARLAREAGLG